MSLFIKKVKQLFLAADENDWDGLGEMIADRIDLDYSSIGSKVKEATRDELVSRWSSLHLGFTHTHYQLSNFICSTHNENAKVFCYVTASHYLEDKGGNVWTVVGTYEIELKKFIDEFKFVKITFNYKYQDGNLALGQKAIEALK